MGCVLLLDRGHRTLGAGACGHPAAGAQLCNSSGPCYLVRALWQGRRKQSPDGQAQLDVGGKVVNNSRAKRAAKIWTLVFLAVRRHSHCTSASNWDSKAWKFSHTERKSYACALRYVRTLATFNTRIRDYTNVEHVIMSQLWLRMVRPWPDQPDRFRCLCVINRVHAGEVGEVLS